MRETTEERTVPRWTPSSAPRATGGIARVTLCVAAPSPTVALVTLEAVRWQDAVPAKLLLGGAWRGRPGPKPRAASHLEVRAMLGSALGLR